LGVNIQRLLAEFLGTALLVATVVGSGIMATRLTGDIGLQLLINSLATIFILIVIITIFAQISGAQFNPVVTLVEYFSKRISALWAASYLVVQFLGAIFGVMTANLMFELPAISAATKLRSGSNLFLGEVIATAGLILIINLLMAQDKKKSIPTVVALWIGAGYFFTSSTSFANPAVTFARSLTDSFTGIKLDSVPAFIFAQLIGAALGMLAVKIFQSELSKHE
jgi:glycerol uptake facilitator-like aquaporin